MAKYTAGILLFSERWVAFLAFAIACLGVDESRFLWNFHYTQFAPDESFARHIEYVHSHGWLNLPRFAWFCARTSTHTHTYTAP